MELVAPRMPAAFPCQLPQRGRTRNGSPPSWLGAQLVAGSSSALHSRHRHPSLGPPSPSLWEGSSETHPGEWGSGI